MDIKKLLKEKNTDELLKFFKDFDWSASTHNIPGMVYSGSIAKNIHFGSDVTSAAPAHHSKKGQLRDIDLGVMNDDLDWLFEFMQTNFPLDKSVDKEMEDMDSFKQLDAETQKRVLDDIKTEKYTYFTMTFFKFLCPVSKRKVEIHKTNDDKTIEIYSYIHKENVRVTSLYTFIMGSLEWRRPKDIYFLQICNKMLGTTKIPVPSPKREKGYRDYMYVSRPRSSGRSYEEALLNYQRYGGMDFNYGTYSEALRYDLPGTLQGITVTSTQQTGRPVITSTPAVTQTFDFSHLSSTSEFITQNTDPII